MLKEHNTKIFLGLVVLAILIYVWYDYFYMEESESGAVAAASMMMGGGPLFSATTAGNDKYGVLITDKDGNLSGTGKLDATTGNREVEPSVYLDKDGNIIIDSKKPKKTEQEKGKVLPGVINIKNQLPNEEWKTNMQDNVPFSNQFQEQISIPNGDLRMNSQGIIFGGPNKSGYESSSAQISAGLHDKDSLCIVGMSKDTPQNRRITMWGEGGITMWGENGVNMNTKKINFPNNWSMDCSDANVVRFTNNGAFQLSVHKTFPGQPWSDLVEVKRLKVGDRDILAELDTLKNCVRYGDKLSIISRKGEREGYMFSSKRGVTAWDSSNAVATWELERK